MAKQQRGLGRGLSELLGSGADSVSFRTPVRYVNSSGRDNSSSDGLINEIDIDGITPNPYQPRVTFDQDALEELASSIRTLGLIQPITVRKVNNGRYQIISGERRFRASRLAGLTKIPAYVRETDDVGMLELAIVENVQRENLDPIETAMSYQRLIDECHLTQEKMAERIGKNRVSVTNFIRLLKLPAKVQYELKIGRISVGHAKALLSLDDFVAQEELCDKVILEGLSVRDLEGLVRKISEDARTSRKRKNDVQTGLPEEYCDIAEILGKYFDDRISVRRSSSGKGVMTIRFTNDTQLSDFLKALKKSKL